MGQGQQTVLLRDYEGNPGATNIQKIPVNPDSNTVTVPAPAGTVRPSGAEEPLDADGYLVLYDTETLMEYDFWTATTVRDAAGNSLGGGQPGNSILEAGAIDFFDVTGPGTNPPTFFSARAVGTPLLAGLILPEDIERGAIEHALAFAIPGPRNTNVADPQEPFSKDYFPPRLNHRGRLFQLQSASAGLGPAYPFEAGNRGRGGESD